MIVASLVSLSGEASKSIWGPDDARVGVKLSVFAGVAVDSPCRKGEEDVVEEGEKAVEGEESSEWGTELEDTMPIESSWNTSSSSSELESLNLEKSSPSSSSSCESSVVDATMRWESERGQLGKETRYSSAQE